MLFWRGREAIRLCGGGPSVLSTLCSCPREPHQASVTTAIGQGVAAATHLDRVRVPIHEIEYVAPSAVVDLAAPAEIVRSLS